MKIFYIVFSVLFMTQSVCSQEESALVLFFESFYENALELLDGDTSIYFKKPVPICTNLNDGELCDSCLREYLPEFILEKLPRERGFLVHGRSAMNPELIRTYKFYRVFEIVYVERYFSLNLCLGGNLTEDIMYNRSLQEKNKIPFERLQLSSLALLKFRETFEHMFKKASNPSVQRYPKCQFQRKK